uniref:Uncharacterized protein n=1 Tax=Arundo donax TaxID=35708 RepID=A0A0A9AT21_ARUDO
MHACLCVSVLNRKCHFGPVDLSFFPGFVDCTAYIVIVFFYPCCLS